jgi:fructuronate reductase
LPGLIVEALHRRRTAGPSPFTVASCDNLPANGKAVARVVCELAEHRDPVFASWVSGNVAFPSSMVDRMVPATTDADRTWCRENGIDAAEPIVTEPFTQWVLEDHFPAGRPDWGSVGVELVDDVARHEQAKLRSLNAAHSALAYWGLLVGHDYIWQAVDDPVLLAATNEFVECEVIPNLEVPAGWDLERYAAQVMGRFGNRALPYTTAKVAGDGSQKLPVRLMPTVAALGAAGRPAPRSAQVLAAWLAVAVGPRARTFAIDDPALNGGPAADVVRRGLADGVTVGEAVDLLHRLRGFVLPRRPDPLSISAQVIRAAHQMWHGDVRAMLARPAGQTSAGTTSLEQEVQR